MAVNVVGQINSGEPFLIEVVEDGVVLHDADSFYERLLAEARQAKQRWGLVRVSDGWRWGESV